MFERDSKNNFSFLSLELNQKNSPDSLYNKYNGGTDSLNLI